MNPDAAAASIAIIGMSCRTSGADTLGELWRLLRTAQRRFAAVPSGRWPGLDETTWPEPRAALLDQIDRFDARLFGVSPRMAAWMDPQHRMALELAWQAVENAGYDPNALAGQRIGVWAGAFLTDYRERIAATGKADAAAFPGTLMAFTANRISYQFDWTGPSMVIDSACSSSLSALAAAVFALRAGECEMALVAAPNVISAGYYAGNALLGGALSRTGESTPFSADRNGYVRGEGGACVLLKRLDLALADGDPVHAIVRAVGTGHNGRGGGLTGTDSRSQASLLRTTTAAAGCSVLDLGYLEAHGTATKTGDAAELAALHEVLAEATHDGERPSGPQGRLWIGSIKANIGHLEGASGLIGLIKTVLVLRHGLIPRIAGLSDVDPDLPVGDPLALATEDVPWPRNATTPRRAAVNSFGLGGALAQVLIEEPPSRGGPVDEDQAVHVLPLAADDEPALRALAARLHAELADEAPPRLAELAWTLQTGRAARRVRTALLVSDPAELPQALASAAQGDADRWAADRIIEAGQALTSDTVAAVRRWLAGGDAGWTGLWSGPRPVRVALPCAPFVGKSHWFDRGAR
ncbi:MAG TPA: beta-ketoacyl synthase N-terminal-like domain-containing protein [Pseudonocardiaceae bacterium]